MTETRLNAIIDTGVEISASQRQDQWVSMPTLWLSPSVQGEESVTPSEIMQIPTLKNPGSGHGYAG